MNSGSHARYHLCMIMTFITVKLQIYVVEHANTLRGITFLTLVRWLYAYSKGVLHLYE